MVRTNGTPTVNDGIHGLLKYSPEMVESLKKDMERIKKIYPVSSFEVNLSDTYDRRWNRWRNHNDNNGNEKMEMQDELFDPATDWVLEIPYKGI
jgi:hypothetical protein